MATYVKNVDKRQTRIKRKQKPQKVLLQRKSFDAFFDNNKLP